MFVERGSTLKVHGVRGEILFGATVAAHLGAWTIRKADGAWWLTARIIRCDRFSLRRRPLDFTAPRTTLPPWYWGLAGVPEVVGLDLRVKLGPPVQ